MAEFARRAGNRSDLEMKILRGLMTGLEAWADLAVDEAKEYAPVLTGRLAREIKKDETGAKEIDRLVGAIDFGVSGLEYARAHELGSGIHALDPSARELIEIKPITPGVQALRFPWPDGPTDHPAYNEEQGVFYFARVFHPGVPPANQGEGYLRKAAHETESRGKRLLLLAVTAEMRRQ